MTFRRARGQLFMSAQEPPGFEIRGPIERADLPGLYARACRVLIATAGPVVWCDVLDVEPNAVTVDALARLQLAARRHGCRVTLRGLSSELRDLIAAMGLADVLGA